MDELPKSGAEANEGESSGADEKLKAPFEVNAAWPFGPAGDDFPFELVVPLVLDANREDAG
jgi:hypothetical protein